MNKLTRLLLVSRPISWVNTAYPFAAGYLVTGGGVSPVLIIGSLFFLIPYNLLMYGINDVFDYESDIRNPRKGGIEGMREERAFHPFIMRASLIVPLPFVAYLLVVGNRLSDLVLIGLLFFVVAYSIKGLRFKEKPVLDSITSSFHFVGPLVYALALTGSSVNTVWPFVLAFLVWGAASHAFGAVQDIIPDRDGGLASIATAFGAKMTVRLCVALYTAAALIMFAVGGYAIIAAVAGILYVGNILPYVSVTDAASGQTNRAWRRFIRINLLAGFLITLSLILWSLAQ